MKLIIRLISSCFYLGYIPFASGTFGSLFGLGIYFLIYTNNYFYAMITLFFVSLGFLVCGPAEKMFTKKDPSKIVIDEASGLLIALFLIPPKIFYIIIGFLLYRFFDILKPFPLKRLEKMNSSSAVMLDDIGAAIYTNLSLQCLIFLKSI